MDGQRFDRLTRSFATASSRRAVLKGLAGSVAAGALTLVGGRRADADHNARCRDFDDNCRSNAECCSGACVDFHCACPPGTVLCEGSQQCVPACTGGEVLDPETCQCECPDATSTCGVGCCPDQDFRCCGNICRPCPTGGACPGTSCNPFGSPTQCCSAFCQLINPFTGQGVCQ